MRRFFRIAMILVVALGVFTLSGCERVMDFFSSLGLRLTDIRIDAQTIAVDESFDIVVFGIYDDGSLTARGTLIDPTGGRIDLGRDGPEARRARGISGLISNPRLMLNPVVKIETYFDRVLGTRGTKGRDERRAEAVRIMQSVGITDSETRLGQYPFQLSGGTAQRVAIGLALAAGARALCLDEYTAGLDVTIQRQVLDQVMELRREKGIGVLFATSDLAIAANFSDRMLILGEGRISETGETREVMTDPRSVQARRLIQVSNI